MLFYLSIARNEAGSLLAAAETRWERPVSHCPEWDAAGLVRHTGGILEWMAAVVTSGERVSRRALESPPENVADLATWYLSALDKTVECSDRRIPTRRHGRFPVSVTGG